MLTVCLTGITARAQPASIAAVPRSDDYVLRVWDMNEGLPKNEVSGLAQTPDGYLWIVTPGGLARFDGVRFSRGFASNVERLFSARDGALWLRQNDGGILRGDGHHFSIVLAAGSDLIRAEMPPLVEDDEGGIWFRDLGGTRTWRWWRGKLRSDNPVRPPALKLLDAPQPRSFTQAAGGGAWVVRQPNLLRLRGDGTKEVVADLSWLGDVSEISRIFESREGDLWIGTRYDGLFRYRAGKFTRVTTSHPAISAIGQDREGNLWVGTHGGLNRLKPRGFSLRRKENGIPENQISSLAEDQSGRIWITGRGDDPVRATDGENMNFNTPPGWPGGMTFALAADPKGGMWIASSSGLTRWREPDYQAIIKDSQITAVLADRRGDVWAAQITGPLFRHHDGVTDPVPTTGGLHEARALAEDSQGRIWVGTEAGLVFLRLGDEFLPVPLPGAKSGDPVRIIVPDGADTVWIATAKGGIFRWRAGGIARVVPGAGFPGDELHSLAVGLDGDFWVGTERGLFRMAREAVEAALAGEKGAPQPIYFGAEEGFPSMEFSPGFRNATLRARDGRLWFATVRGALEINLEAFRSAPPVPVRIEELRVGDKALGDHPSVPPRPGPIMVRYSLPDPSEAHRLRFRHRLVGLGEDAWFSAGDQRVATFSYLPPGNYRFEVQASKGDGRWLPSVGALDFTVRAAWWETPAFRVSMTIAGLLALGWMVRWLALRRVRRRMRRLEQENALERERARIARDMHDELGASLTRISLMGELAAVEPGMAVAAGARFMKVAAAARDVSGTLDRIVWTINPNNDTLERLVGYLDEFAREYLESTGLSLRSELPATLPARVVPSDTRHELLLAMKEALNNIAKHAGARQVVLRFIFENNRLTLILTDDGRGFDPSAVSPTSNGLTNLHKRMDTLGGTARIEAASGAGTSVTLELPLPV